jgi:transmembrane sensor
MGVFRKRRPPASIRREAIAWIHRLAKPNVTEDEKARCKAWLDSAPENPREFLLASALVDLQAQMRGLPRVDSILEELDAAAGPSDVTPEPSDVVPESLDKATSAREPFADRRTAHQHSAQRSKHEQLARQHVSPPTRRARPARRRVYIAVAAVTAAAVILGIGAAIIAPRLKSAPSYSTGIGESRRVALEDGSTIQLNTDSHVRMTFTSRRREAHLFRGEALFDVEYDAQRPFDVVTQCGTMRALSTTFVVYARPNGTCDLIVENGRVRASAHAAHQTVAHHQMAIIADRVDVQQLTGREVRRRLAWTHGLLMFENTRLAEAVAQFNRYNKTQLVVDPRLDNIAIGGRFIATRAREFAMALAAVRVRAVERSGPKGNVIWLQPDGTVPGG